MRALSRLAESLFEEELEVRVPSSLGEWPAGAVRLFEKASTLRSAGIISRWHEVVRDFPDEPFLYAFESSRDDAAAANGFDFFDKDAALVRMLAESYERGVWSEEALDGRYAVRDAASDELRGEPFLPPSSFAGFWNGEEDMRRLAPSTGSARFRWIRVPTLSGSHAWAPLQVMCPRFYREVFSVKEPREPLLRVPVTTGLATAPTRESAILKGLLEVIERDAFMISYTGMLGGKRIDPARLESERLGRILESFRKYGLAIHLIGLPTDMPVHAVLAIIEDETGQGPRLTVGARTSFSLEEAAETAIAEALYGRYIYRRERLGERVLPDSSSSFTMIDRIAFWGRQENRGKLSFFLREDSPTYERDVPRPQSEHEALALLTRALHEAGEQAVYADLTDETGRKLGWHAVFVVVPGLQPMHTHEEFAYRAGRRLSSLPARLGLDIPSIPNQTPHPFP